MSRDVETPPATRLLRELPETAIVPSWTPPPATLSASSGEVHVWRVSLDLDESRARLLRRTLSEEELKRTETYRFDRDRKDFTVARGLLRVILGRYLDVEPAELQFCHNVYGKPRLATRCGGDTLRFNLSRSHALSLIAVARCREVGVDVERIRSDVAFSLISDQLFSPGEAAAIRTLMPSMRRAAFFACWTRKEAYIKATGKGLSIPLDRFGVSVAPGEPAALLTTDWDPSEASMWSLRDVDPGAGYAGALAVQGHDWSLKCWNWSVAPNL